MWIGPRRSRCTASARSPGCSTRPRLGCGRGRSATASSCASRSSGGHRLYSRNQVDQLRYLQNLVDSGLHAAEAHRVLAVRLAEGTPIVPSPGPRQRHAGADPARRARPVRRGVDRVLPAHRGSRGRHRPRCRTTRSSICTSRHPDIVFVELVVSGRERASSCAGQLSARVRRSWPCRRLAIGPDAIDAGAAVFLLKPLDPLAGRRRRSRNWWPTPTTRRPVVSDRRVDGTALERTRRARRGARRWPAAGCHHPRRRGAGNRQDDPVPALRLPQRHPGPPGAVSARRCPSRWTSSCATGRPCRCSTPHRSGTSVLYEDLGALVDRTGRPRRSAGRASTCCSTSTAPRSS